MFHVHESHASRDCDGPFYSDNTYRPSNELFESEETDALDIAMQWGMPWAFHHPDHVDNVVGIEIRIDEQDRYVISYARATDEGFDSGELIICDDDENCEFGYTQRDVFAESMGY